MTIDPQLVIDALMESLFSSEEAAANEDVHGVLVEGIVNNYCFHPARLEEQRSKVYAWLQQLPIGFRPSLEGGGGGWSFLMMCDDKDGHQWTGEHRTMEALCVLAIGLGLASWPLPKDVWEVLPGGMPYFAVK